MPLTTTAIKQAKAKDKPYRLADGEGMYLEVAPSGGKWWRLKYRFAGKEKRLSLGTFPDVGLAEAREKMRAAKALLRAHIDPSTDRKQKKLATAVRHANSFEAVAREWIKKHGVKWTPLHTERLLTGLERDLFPIIGATPIGEIGAPELLHCLRKIEQRGAVYTAHQMRQTCGRIFRYAIATTRASRNPAEDLKGGLAPFVVAHHASIVDPKLVGELLRAIDGYAGTATVRCALRLSPLVFLRPGEIRHAEWTEVDLDEATMRISAGKMKMREQHIVPLPRQAVAVLRELKPLTGDGKYLFPNIRTRSRPMSENTVNAALRRLGYTQDEMTGHGFRSMASTLLNEQGWNSDAIERQLAHGERNKVRAAYNFAEYLIERRRMMQAWADYLDVIRGTDNVVPIKRSA